MKVPSRAWLWVAGLLLGLVGTGCVSQGPASSPAPVRIGAGPPLAWGAGTGGRIHRSQTGIYEVKPADTLWAIAAVHGIDVEDLARWNNIRDPDVILVGQPLVLTPPPAGKSPPPSHPPGATVTYKGFGMDDAGRTAPATTGEVGKPLLMPGSVEVETLAPAPVVVAEPVPEETARVLDHPTTPKPLERPEPAKTPDYPATPKPLERSESARTPDYPATPKPLERPQSPDHPATPKPLERPEPARPAEASGPVARSADYAGILKAPAPKSWSWPLRGKILQRFGQFGQHRYTGIDIAAAEGAPVEVAAPGIVAYADDGLSGYGNLILVRHGGSFMSAYAHNAAILVKPGDKVEAGQIIAKAGKTGSTATSKVHFELRKGITPVDPLQFLPH